MPTRYKNLTDALRAAVEESGQSLNRIAIDAGIPTPALSRFMSGDRALHLDTATKLAIHLELVLVPTSALPENFRIPKVPASSLPEKPRSGRPRSSPTKRKPAGKSGE